MTVRLRDGPRNVGWTMVSTQSCKDSHRVRCKQNSEKPPGACTGIYRQADAREPPCTGEKSNKGLPKKQHSHENKNPRSRYQRSESVRKRMRARPGFVSVDGGMRQTKSLKGGGRGVAKPAKPLPAGQGAHQIETSWPATTLVCAFLSSNPAAPLHAHTRENARPTHNLPEPLRHIGAQLVRHRLKAADPVRRVEDHHSFNSIHNSSAHLAHVIVCPGLLRRREKNQERQEEKGPRGRQLHLPPLHFVVSVSTKPYSF